VPNAPAARPDRDFCVSCGFPVRGGRCEACGSAQPGSHKPDPHSASEQSLLTQSQIRPYASPAEADAAGLERAAEAHRARDMPRFIDLLLAAEAGATSRQAPTTEGAGWVATVRGAAVFVTLRVGPDELVLEAPIARLPGRQRLPALRLALELSARDTATSRVCLRGELLLLRFVARLSLLTPPVLRYYLREIGHLASRYAGLLTVGLDALPAIPEDQRAAATFDAIGRAKKIQLGTGGNIRRSIPPPLPSAERSRPRAPTPEPSSQDLPPPPRTPSMPAPNGGAVPRPVPKAPPPPAPMNADGAVSSDGIPAVLSPMYSPPRAPEVRVELEERFKRSNTAETGTVPNPMPEGTGSRRPPPLSQDPRAEIDLDPASRRGGAAGPGGSPVPSEPQLSPSDRLCMLLRHAQSLTSLSLEERPATMVWLVRSAVFRAIYDFKDVLPDAVAHLYRCTGVGRDAPPASRTLSGQMQGTEPALVVMERVIVARAMVQKEKPLAIEPMVSAAQAKDHVARYLLELDRAPSDAGMRHFLAMGALTELLVRTKLPPQTDQRLRDIVGHAQREGAKTSAIDLMMTALQRINA
jgi:hypothetical protein